MVNLSTENTVVPDCINQDLARRAAEKLAFQYMLVAEASTKLRANAARYNVYCDDYKNATCDSEKAEVIKQIIADMFGWTNLDDGDIKFIGVSFDELFGVDANNLVEYDSDDVDSMVIEQDFKCGICGESLDFNDAEAEHLFAKVYFGNRLGTRNIRAAHKRCNCMKGTMLFASTYHPEHNWLEYVSSR